MPAPATPIAKRRIRTISNLRSLDEVNLLGLSTLWADQNPPFVVRRIVIRREPGWPMEHSSSFAPSTSLGTMYTNISQ
jgi:hypothetical protein